MYTIKWVGSFMIYMSTIQSITAFPRTIYTFWDYAARNDA